MKNTTWDASTRRTVAIILGTLFIYLVYLARPVLPFLIIAGLIAFILAPIVSFLRQKLHFPKALAITVAYLLLAIVVLVFVPLIIVPALVSAFADINIDLAAIIISTQHWVIDTLEMYRFVEFLGIPLDLSPVIDRALEYIYSISPIMFVPSLEAIIAYIPSTVQITLNVATNLFGRIVSIFLAILLTLLYSIYLSGGAEEMRQNAMRYVPPPYQPEILQLGTRIQRVWNAYLRGQLTLGIIIWLITWLVGEMIGLPGAFALGVIAGTMEIIPNLGPFLAAVPGLLAALLQGSEILPVSNLTFFFIVLGMYVIIQQVENALIVPRVLGDAVELSPLVVMAGVVVGFTVGGILGALVAAPVIATGREIVTYAYAKVMMLDPYPPEQEVQKKRATLLERGRGLWQKAQPPLHAFYTRAITKIIRQTQDKEPVSSSDG